MKHCVNFITAQLGMYMLLQMLKFKCWNSCIRVFVPEKIYMLFLLSNGEVNHFVNEMSKYKCIMLCYVSQPPRGLSEYCALHFQYISQYLVNSKEIWFINIAIAWCWRLFQPFNNSTIGSNVILLRLLSRAISNKFHTYTLFTRIEAVGISQTYYVHHSDQRQRNWYRK